LAAVRTKSVALTELFISEVDDRLPGVFGLASPRGADERGSHVALTHPEAYAVKEALIARGVVGDFRPPDILRLGFAPLYVRFVDAWDAVDRLQAVMASRGWDRPAYRRRAVVT
jgi:kynureninase